jgi:hypothetical protein
MPRSTLFMSAVRDLGDDIAYHVVGLAHGAFDLMCVLALGMLVYASGIDTANAGLQGRPMFGVQASIDGTNGVGVTSSHAPTSCSLTNDLLPSGHNDCITAVVLDPLDA